VPRLKSASIGQDRIFRRCYRQRVRLTLQDERAGTKAPRRTQRMQLCLRAVLLTRRLIGGLYSWI
jgi:hypothetical protein